MTRQKFIVELPKNIVVSGNDLGAGLLKFRGDCKTTQN